MRIVRSDLVRRARAAVHGASEWPVYSIFVYLEQFDTIAIAPRSYLHGDLFVILKQDWINSGNLPIELDDAGVFDGHIECEDDGTMIVRDQRGQSVPPWLESAIRNAFQEVERDVP